MKPRSLLFLSLTSLVLALSGCGGGGGASLPDPQVRVLNLSPGTKLDVVVDNDVKIRDVDYLEADPGTFRESPDTYDIALRDSSTGFDYTTEAYTLTGDRDYLIAAIGLKDFGDEALKRLRASVIQFDRRVPNGTKARVIALHGYLAETGSQTPNVQFRGPGDSPQVQFGTIPLGGAAVLDLDAGPQTLEARPEGAERVIATTTQTLLPGRIYVAALTGTDGATGDSAPAIRLFEIPSRR